MIADTRAGGGSRVLDQDQMAIEIGDLVADYGRKRAVDGLSIRVPVGSVYACIALATGLLLLPLWLFNRKAY
ncbi:hypothetical protein BH24ACT17_BH24ACT17_10420 [soil metagenome]